MLEAIEMFRDRGTRDELGLSTVRDGFADLMFPGTGSLQTRARYFMFVPWMYRLLEEQRVSSAEVSRKARQFEVKLINALAESEDRSGIIGIQKRAALQRLPSSIYWSGLKRLGIRQFSGAQDEYHKSLDGWCRANRRAVKNDDGEVEGRPGRNWHDVPPMPEGFPERAELRVTEPEAEYLRRRVLTEAPASLFAFIIDRVNAESDFQFVWDHPLSGTLPPDLAKQVLHARNFAEAMHGAPILYNLMLANMEPRRENLLPGLEQVFEHWRGDVQTRRADLLKWDRQELWEILRVSGARITPLTRDFVEAWVDLLLDAPDPRSLLHSERAQELILKRERRLKGNLARLHNQAARERWNGNSGLSRLEYRWATARAILNDMMNAGGA
ncbi:MAG: hypothetical protein H0T05_03155 [Acidobacteria bacterium]|nr:hypothetical protein [Acidobacteriota bacterium]